MIEKIQRPFSSVLPNCTFSLEGTANIFDAYIRFESENNGYNAQNTCDNSVIHIDDDTTVYIFKLI